MKLKWLVAACLLLGLSLAAGPVLAGSGEVPRISIEDLNKNLGNPEWTVIDVRAGSDWRDSPDKIKGAVRQEPKEVEAWSADYDKAKTVVLYCA